MYIKQTHAHEEIKDLITSHMLNSVPRSTDYEPRSAHFPIQISRLLNHRPSNFYKRANPPTNGQIPQRIESEIPSKTGNQILISEPQRRKAHQRTWSKAHGRK